MKFLKTKKMLNSFMAVTATLISIGYSGAAQADYTAPSQLKYLCHLGGGEFYEKADGAFGCRYKDGTKISCDVFGRFCTVKEPGKVKIVAPNNRVSILEKLRVKMLEHEEQVDDSYTPISKKTKKLK